MDWRTLILPLASLSLLLSACGQKQEEGPAEAPDQGSGNTVPEEAPAVLGQRQVVDGDDSPSGEDSLTESERSAFTQSPEMRKKVVAACQRIEVAVRTGDYRSLEAEQDLERLIQRCTAGVDMLEVPQQARIDFLSGLRGSLRRKEGGIFQSLAGSRPVFLRYREVDGKPHPIFRINLNGSLSYWELLMELGPDGETRVVDILDFTKGGYSSEMIRMGMLHSFASAKKAEDDQQQDEEQRSELGQAVAPMMDFLRAGKFEEAHDFAKALPESTRHNKILLLFRIKAAASLVYDTQGKEDPVWTQHYSRSMELMREHHPESPALALILLDYYIIKKLADEALANIDTLDKIVGGDPYLDIYRSASIAHDSTRQDQSLRYSKQAFKALPDLEEPAHHLLDLALEQKDHSTVEKVLTHLEGTFGYDLHLERKPEIFGDFLSSEEGKRWKASR